MKHFALALVALGLVTFCVNCDSTESTGTSTGGATPPSTSSAAGKSIKVALLPKKKGVPYVTTCAAGAEKAAKELGNVELIYDGPTDGSPEKAASMIEKWTLQGVDVIAVSPNDPDVLAPAMTKARQNGQRVIT